MGGRQLYAFQELINQSLVSWVFWTLLDTCKQILNEALRAKRFRLERNCSVQSLASGKCPVAASGHNRHSEDRSEPDR